MGGGQKSSVLPGARTRNSAGNRIGIGIRIGPPRSPRMKKARGRFCHRAFGLQQRVMRLELTTFTLAT